MNADDLIQALKETTVYREITVTDGQTGIRSEILGVSEIDGVVDIAVISDTSAYRQKLTDKLHSLFVGAVGVNASAHNSAVQKCIDLILAEK